jgi:hypothetical protein
MSRMFSTEDVDAVRADHPDCAVCTVIGRTHAFLIAIPRTRENLSRRIPGAEMFTGADIDGMTLKPSYTAATNQQGEA